MELNGNKRLVYDVLREFQAQDKPVSFGTVACICRCDRRTVIRAVHTMTAAGVLHKIHTGERRPNRYILLI